MSQRSTLIKSENQEWDLSGPCAPLGCQTRVFHLGTDFLDDNFLRRVPPLFLRAIRIALSASRASSLIFAIFRASLVTPFPAFRFSLISTLSLLTSSHRS